MDDTAIIKSFYEEDKLPDNLIVIYDDGSGCEIFFKREGKYHSGDGEFIVPDKHWFTDAEYIWFIELPEDFLQWL